MKYIMPNFYSCNGIYLEITFQVIGDVTSTDGINMGANYSLPQTTK